jgi:predicted porin
MRKFALLSTTLVAGVVSIPAAHAVDVKLYGQVNKTAAVFDDGQNTDFGVYDNDLSSTRFGVKGEQKLDNGLTASVLLEMEMQSNPSNLFTQNTAAGNSSTPLGGGNGGAGSTVGIDERHASVGLSGDFGGVVLGQTSTATDSVFTQDLVGAQDVLNSDYRKMGGGLFLRNSNGTLSATSINSLTFDGGTNRTDAIRYDSPKLTTAVGTFQGKASVAQGGDTEASALYEGKVAGFKLKGAAAVQFNNDLATSTATNNYDTRYIASASALHSSGIGATAAYTTDKLRDGVAGQDPEQWYTKVGYAWDAYEVAADYGQSNHYGNAVLSENKLTAMGLGAQYNMGNGVSLAGLYRNFDANRTGTSLQDVDLFAANLRVKF